MSKNVDKNACVLCNRSYSTVIEKCAGGYQVLKCSGCGLFYVDPIPSKELFNKAYSEEYYTPWLENQRMKRIKMWKSRLETLNNFSRRQGNLLDAGCGECLFLELAREDGWDVTGTEISPFAVKYGRERLDLNILQGELKDIGFPDKTFDAVTMWHVLEHTTNPLVILKEIRRILKDDGVLILAIPNLNNIVSQWAYRLVKGKRMHLFDPLDRELHLYHFTPETIRLALEKAGFRIEEIVPDMGIVQWHIRSLNYFAKGLSLLIGSIITDAIEVHAILS
jgi:2-polyprenyl-3-methyl-5-hydroxy-6-metoxy-1,4-benzoquinol methylase